MWCIFRFCVSCVSDKSKVKPWSQNWLIAAEAYPRFCSLKRLRVFLLPLDRMLVHRRSLLQQLASTHLYSWVERGTVRVECLSQEHNTVSPAKARNRTVRSGNEGTDHKATVPHKMNDEVLYNFFYWQLDICLPAKLNPPHDQLCRNAASQYLR